MEDQIEKDNIEEALEYGQFLEYVAGQRKSIPEFQKRQDEMSTKEAVQHDKTTSFEFEEDYPIRYAVEIQEVAVEIQSDQGIISGSEDVLVDFEDDRIETKEHQQEEVLISATYLRSKFDCTEAKMKKATNAPKFLYNVFRRNIEEELPINQQFEAHLNWINKYYNRHDKDKTITRSHLNDLFGPTPSDHRKMRRSEVRRGILQRRLSCQRKHLILDNQMIPPSNKEHYLYFCKVYEWRLNCSELVSQFN